MAVWNCPPTGLSGGRGAGEGLCSYALGALVPTRLRTVVFTDLANYTASVLRADRETLRQLIVAHEEVVAQSLEKAGGRVVKNLGDSYMALFESATDAVRAGLHLIEGIRAAGGLNLRVAMATGDVEVIDEDAFGDAVNLASRLLSRTPEGEIWFCHATNLCMNQAEIPWDRVGRIGGFKGIEGEVEVFRGVPTNRAFLPQAVREAAILDRLVRIHRGEPIPPLPEGAVVLLEGFVPGSRVLDELVDRLPVTDPARLWLCTYNLPNADRVRWESGGRGILIGTPDAIRGAIGAVASPARSTGSDTIIIDVGSTSVVDLVVAGLALPAVPMSEVVAGYTYDLLQDGRWVNRSDQAVARVDVHPGEVFLETLKPGVLLRGRQMPTGEVAKLLPGDVIVGPSGPIRFLNLNGEAYAGLLLSDSPGRVGVSPGHSTELGREPNLPGMALLDRKGQDNIRWCSGPRSARARAGGFTLDRALAGRRQCVIAHGPQGLTVKSTHDRCPTWLVAGDRLVNVGESRPIAEGDLVVAGTTVVALRPPEG
jgi:class 3 adenylate cyclase